MAYTRGRVSGEPLVRVTGQTQAPHVGWEMTLMDVEDGVTVAPAGQQGLQGKATLKYTCIECSHLQHLDYVRWSSN